MSIVAENSQNSTHGSAKKSTQQSQNNTELAVKVMTTRENRYITKECNQTKSNFTFKRPTYSTSECTFGRVTTAVTSTATDS